MKGNNTRALIFAGIFLFLAFNLHRKYKKDSEPERIPPLTRAAKTQIAMQSAL